MGVKNVIVTLGKKGVLLKTPQVCHYFPATETKESITPSLETENPAA
jgi:sugar/nucleoside kinase (ribokinase family)